MRSVLTCVAYVQRRMHPTYVKYVIDNPNPPLNAAMHPSHLASPLTSPRQTNEKKRSEIMTP